MENKNYSSDFPVDEKNQDRFSRWGFSERIGQIISRRYDPSGIIIGLHGVWGDGKTSAINFIEKSLECDKNVICIKFNPWRYGSEDELLLGFFQDIAEALDAKLVTRNDQFKKLAKAIAPGAGACFGFKWAGDTLGSFISLPKIDELKKRVEKELESAKKRVLILIDDVDRLDKTEIHALFRLVKLTADFKYTAYILAFDKNIVAASLQERYPGKSERAGEDFLEKIIQIPLHLPAIPQQELSQFCLQEIEDALRIAEIVLSNAQIQRFHYGYVHALEGCMTTPRKAKLYANTLMFSLPILKGEVNPVDLMLVEGIRILCPSLYQTIRANKDIFAGTFGEGQLSDDERENIKNIIDGALGSEENIDKNGFINMLQNMFPKLEQVYGHTAYASIVHNEWYKEQRICSDDYFSRYFGYAVPKYEISDSAVKDLFHDSGKWSKPYDPQINPLNQLMTESAAKVLIHKLRNESGHVSPDTSTALAIAVAQKSHVIPNPETLFPWTTPFANAGALVSDLIQNLDKSNRVELAKTCIDEASSIEFKLEVFKWLKREGKNKPEKDAFSASCINDIGKHLGRVLFENLNKSEGISHIKSNFIPEMLYWLNEFVHSNCANEYVARLIARNPESLAVIIDAYVPTKFGGVGEGYDASFKEGLGGDDYNTLTKALDAKMIFEAIQQNFPEAVSKSDRFPKVDDGNTDRNFLLLAKFAWHYQRENDARDKEDA